MCNMLLLVPSSCGGWVNVVYQSISISMLVHQSTCSCKNCTIKVGRRCLWSPVQVKHFRSAGLSQCGFAVVVVESVSAAGGASHIKFKAWVPLKLLVDHNYYLPKKTQIQQNSLLLQHHVIQQCTYGSDSPGRGKWAKCGKSFFWSFTVTKRLDFFKFSQLFWRDFVRGTLKILLFWS